MNANERERQTTLASTTISSAEGEPPSFSSSTLGALSANAPASAAESSAPSVRVGSVEMPARYALWVAIACGGFLILVFAIPTWRDFAAHLVDAYFRGRTSEADFAKADLLPGPASTRDARAAGPPPTPSLNVVEHRAAPSPRELTCSHDQAPEENPEGVRLRNNVCLSEFKKHPTNREFTSKVRAIKCHCQE